MIKKVEVRRFNEAGNDKFTTLVRVKDPTIISQVNTILSDDSLTEPLLTTSGARIEIEVVYHEKRFDHAIHLWSYFGPGNPLHHLLGDVSLWNWISATWMVEIMNKSGKPLGEVLGKQEERWILTHSTLRYHRHLVSGPLFALEANQLTPINAMCMLATPVVAPGELVERIAGKRKLSIGSVCHLATLLFYDPVARKLRDGHTASPGNPKAFSYYFSQLDVNVDYLSMSVDDLLNLLPENFSRWVRLAKLERSKGLS